MEIKKCLGIEPQDSQVNNPTIDAKPVKEATPIKISNASKTECIQSTPTQPVKEDSKSSDKMIQQDKSTPKIIKNPVIIPVKEDKENEELSNDQLLSIMNDFGF